uniref:Uncharacterized protein n=1 Tax=Anguilla anguilla TaxID=7936 RepID=A0A0E9TZL6_ANGAN
MDLRWKRYSVTKGVLFRMSFFLPIVIEKLERRRELQ